MFAMDDQGEIKTFKDPHKSQVLKSVPTTGIIKDEGRNPYKHLSHQLLIFPSLHFYQSSEAKSQDSAPCSSYKLTNSFTAPQAV